MNFEKNDLYSKLLNTGQVILKRFEVQIRDHSNGKRKIAHLSRGYLMGIYATRFRYFSMDYCLRLELHYGDSLEDGTGELCLYRLRKTQYPEFDYIAANVFRDAEGKHTNRLAFDLQSRDIHYHGPVANKSFTRDSRSGLIAERDLLPAILLCIQMGMTNTIVVPQYQDD